MRLAAAKFYFMASAPSVKSRGRRPTLIRLQKISGFTGTLSDVAQDFLVNTRQVLWVRKKGVTP
jgi:hypothetical protein